MATDPREPYGQLVRETWTAWAREQPRPWKASHLTGWDELDPDGREVDMRIGEAVAAAERTRLAGLQKAAGSVPETAEWTRRRALLGRRVRVTLDYPAGKPAVIQEGILLGFGDLGDFEIQGDGGDVYHCWPMLDIEEIRDGQ